METSKKPSFVNAPATAVKEKEDKLRNIAYSMDALVPGFYLWFWNVTIQLGGCEADNDYPGTIHSPFGIAIVLPGYRILSTYRGMYDPL